MQYPVRMYGIPVWSFPNRSCTCPTVETMFYQRKRIIIPVLRIICIEHDKTLTFQRHPWSSLSVIDHLPVRDCESALCNVGGGGGGGFQKLGLHFSLGIPIIRMIIFWGLHWYPLVWGNYYIRGLV